MKMATNIIIITEFCELNNYNSSNLNTKKELNFSQTTVPKRKPISINFRKDTHITERELQHRTLKRISEKDSQSIFETQKVSLVKKKRTNPFKCIDT
jgi:hypothetical protein